MSIFELHGEGKGIKEISRELGFSRNTVRKYLRAREVPERKPAPRRPSILDPYKEKVLELINKGVWNCVVIKREIEKLGYSGGITILKDFVQPFRVRRQPEAVMRYETKPGEQAQADWGQESSGYSIPRYALLKPRERLTRKRTSDLEWVKQRFPALYELYQLKEDLRKIARLGDENEAKQEISRWLINAESAANAEGWVWARTVRRWRQELLNLAYYTGQGRRYTNGYIEGKITLIKMVKRLGFGFRNRQSFLKKALIGCCSQEQIPQLLT